MPINNIVPITKSTLNNSSYIGALVLATAGNKLRLLLAHMQPIISVKLIRMVYIAVFGSNTKLLEYLYPSYIEFVLCALSTYFSRLNSIDFLSFVEVFVFILEKIKVVLSGMGDFRFFLVVLL